MKSILLIDDDELLCELLADLLDLEGYQVTVAGDGEQGLAQLAAGQFDLIILDLLMPRMDGVRFLRAMGELYPDPPPVAVLSASATGEVLDALKVPGVVDVIRKPIQPSDLIVRIAALLGTT
jgi:CheY-like chemotaxis protein